jgi:hypothetical protein
MYFLRAFKANVLLFLFLSGVIIFEVSCQKDSTSDPDSTSDQRKEILDFSLKRADGSVFLASEISIAMHSDSILLTLPIGTDRTHLIPEITIIGKSVSPASGIMQDFSAPVIYTVTASDGTAKKYVVSVSLAPPPNNGSSSLAGVWGVLKDSITNTGDYYFRENGINYFPIPGILIGTTSDYYEFKSDGKLNINENRISATLSYQHLLPDTILMSPGPVYDTALIKTFTANHLTLYWRKTSSNGGVLTRMLYLKR